MRVVGSMVLWYVLCWLVGTVVRTAVLTFDHTIYLLSLSFSCLQNLAAFLAQVREIIGLLCAFVSQVGKSSSLSSC